ncbi:MAG TPA: SpoIIE family protein phosphatase [Spirochaetota bacterium]|nr:SpoIIE family protein phosphatase [Spirochaetota bacterium]
MTKRSQDKKKNILCIDDSRLNRAFIRKALEPLNFNVDEAETGQKGLDLLADSDYDLILLDIVMPEMDGFTFLKELKKREREDFIPVILMTALDDLKSKIKGLNTGADDYLLKPLNEEELIARVMSLLRLKKANSELYEKNRQIKRELEAAKKIQQFVIPHDFSYVKSPGVSGRYIPIEDIGGDFFDCYVLDDKRTAFLIADVTGHGIPAALTMTMSKMLFSIYAPKYDSSSGLLKDINRQLNGMMLDTQYITAFYLIYNNETRQLNYSNAGHTRALFYRADRNQILALDTFGFFLGIMEEVDYEEKIIDVNKGDRLFIYTDGITEAKNREGEEFGEMNLAKFIKNFNELQGQEFCDRLMNTLTGFIRDQEVNDDIAFLNIEF